MSMAPDQGLEMEPGKKFVAIAGNIGVGKSTLVERLAAKLDWDPFYEPAGENPYLPDFYEDMRSWAFQSQVFFLTRRLQAHRQLVDHPTSALQDRTVYEDAEVFAANLHERGFMAQRDYDTYRELYEVLTVLLPAPDLVVYLRASVSTLMDRIARRGRDYEKRIQFDYLSRLNELYEAWIELFSLCPVLTVPADNLNFATNDSHLELISSKIKERLAGKEEVVFAAEEVARVNGGL